MLKKASTPKGIITIRLAQNARGASGQAYHGNLIVPHPIQILVDGVAFTFALTTETTDERRALMIEFEIDVIAAHSVRRLVSRVSQ
ncbi:MAG TPA: hypothetical protein VFE51_15405 [Verrucomicrobiae bacterium]|nr:hypothetical protein [Verrucomicrobiae bacterium]